MGAAELRAVGTVRPVVGTVMTNGATVISQEPQIVVDDSYVANTSYEVLIDGQGVLRQLAASLGLNLVDALVLVPIGQDGQTYSDGADLLVEMNCASTLTQLHPVPVHTRSMHARESGDQSLLDAICVFLTVDQIRLNPTLTVTQVAAGQDMPTGLDLVDGARPVGSLILPFESFDAPANALAFTIILPDSVTFDEVALQGTVRPIIGPNTERALRDEAHSGMAMVLSSLHQISGPIVECAEAVASLAVSRTDIDAELLALHVARQDFEPKAFRNVLDHDPNAEGIANRAIDAYLPPFRRLENLPVTVLLPATDGTVRISEIVCALFRPATLSVTFTDRSKTTYRRTAVLCWVLAAVQAALALRLTVPLTFWGHHGGFLNDRLQQSVLRSSRDSIVTLLILIPAALYADVLVKRPPGPLQKRMQPLGRLVVLPFLAPIVPALTVLGTSEPTWVKGALMLSAIIAAWAGCLCITWSKDKVLYKKRHEALRKKLS